jgi:hypothetical protein
VLCRGKYRHINADLGDKGHSRQRSGGKARNRADQFQLVRIGLSKPEDFSKDTFERAYLPLETNKELRASKPSISQEMVDNFILETWTQTAGEKTTIVRAMLRNGFELVEASSCVSPENYDEKLGREICMKKIKDRVWHLLGFLLQTAVNGVK